MDNDSTQQRRQQRFHRQMMFLGPLVAFLMYSTSDAFVFADSGLRHRQFVAATQIGETNGVPICRPAPGSDVYLRASMWKWDPELVLKKGAAYNLHFSSADISHSYDLDAFGLHIGVAPGQDQSVRFVAEQAGEFQVHCQEYCGPGHDTMIGRLTVEE